MYIFSDKTYRTWHKIKYYIPIFPPGALFCPFFGSFSDNKHVIHCLSISISISRHVFKLMMPWKAISQYEKRVMNDIQDGEASSVADRYREHLEPVLPVRKVAFWIERTLVSVYLFFSFLLRVHNNQLSLYCARLLSYTWGTTNHVASYSCWQTSWNWLSQTSPITIPVMYMHNVISDGRFRWPKPWLAGWRKPW